MDDVKTIPKFKYIVRINKTLFLAINEISKYIIISFFYFKLESILKRRDGKFLVIGCLFYFYKKSDPILVAFVEKLLKLSTKFIINSVKISSDILDLSFWDRDSNF